MITGGLKDCAGSKHLNSEGGGRLLSDLTVDGPCFFSFWAHIRKKPRHVYGRAFWFLIRDVYCLNWPHREQARSHRGLVELASGFVYATDQCGSEPARDEARPAPQNQCRLMNPVNAAIASAERSCWVICALSSSMAGSS